MYCMLTYAMSSAFERRNAVSLAYIAQLMLHSFPSVRREIRDGLGHQVSAIGAGRKLLRPYSRETASNDN